MTAGADQGRGEAAGYEEAISGQTAINVDDFKAIWAALPQNRRALTSCAAIAVASVVLVIVPRLIGSQVGAGPLVNLGYVPLVLPFFLAWAVWKGRTRWAQNAVNDMRSTEGVHFVLDAVGMTIDAPSRKSTTEWDAMAHSLETSSAFAIYLTPASVVVIPKRAFSDTDQVRVRALLVARVPNRPLRGVGKKNVARTLLLWICLVFAFLAIWQFLEPGR